MAEKTLICKERLESTLRAWDNNTGVVPQFVWDAINAMPPENPVSDSSHKICSGYHNGRCWGTSEKSISDCGGDIFKCSFYKFHPLTELYELHKEFDKEM